LRQSFLNKKDKVSSKEEEKRKNFTEGNSRASAQNAEGRAEARQDEMLCNAGGENNNYFSAVFQQLQPHLPPLAKQEYSVSFLPFLLSKTKHLSF
jgi:hypothetical protein